MATVSLHTLGCKLNFTETGSLSRDFVRQGYDVVPFGSRSDIVVINTCTVTAEANRKCRQTIRRAIKSNPDAFVIVTGCYAQLRPDDISSIDGVDLVLGANDKFELFSVAQSFKKRESTQIAVSCIDGPVEFKPSYSAESRTRSFLKIQDGCDYSCSFCTIPMARGRSRSATIDSVLQQVSEVAEAGYREIVLSGVNIGLYGEDLDRSGDLLELLEVLDSSSSIDRFRISSIEPNLLTNEIIEFVAASRRFVPHFHIPLQSGDDEILGLMRRRYRSNVYSGRVKTIKKIMPDACIGSDVIVGFPGESENHFETTAAFIEDLPVSYLHVFTYSERPNTFAADELAKGHAAVPVRERSRRNRILTVLSDMKRAAFYRSQLGTQRSVLWENVEDGIATGFTDNYVRVEMNSTNVVTGTIESVTLNDLTNRTTVDASRMSLPVLAD